MFMRQVQEMLEESQVAAMMGELYSFYTDIGVMYYYTDFVLTWMMPSIIYDVMPLPQVGSIQKVGSSHSTCGATTSVVTTT